MLPFDGYSAPDYAKPNGYDGENYSNTRFPRIPQQQPGMANMIPTSLQNQQSALEHPSLSGHQTGHDGMGNPFLNGVQPGQDGGSFNPAMQQPTRFESHTIGAPRLVGPLPAVTGFVPQKVPFTAPAVTAPIVPPTSVSNLGQLYMLTNSANGIGIQPVTISAPARKPGKNSFILLAFAFGQKSLLSQHYIFKIT